MNIGILTSVETRHRYFVQTLRKAVNVVAVAYETTGYTPAEAPSPDLTIEESEIVARHFRERSRQEEAFFGHDCAWMADAATCRVRKLVPGTLNTTETLGFLDGASVDAVVVYGTNLIKSPLLERWPGRMINMHLGLSPYYRGTATNFYPLLNEEPEYIGATIHHIDAGIDSGSILAHARPRIAADDMPHTIGCKAIVAGIEKMITVLGRLASGSARSVAQWEVPDARLYLRKDYHPLQVVELYRKIDAGLIGDCVARLASAPPRIRLVDAD